MWHEGIPPTRHVHSENTQMQLSLSLSLSLSHTHTHTHVSTFVYSYIRIRCIETEGGRERERQKERLTPKLIFFGSLMSHYWPDSFVSCQNKVRQDNAVSSCLIVHSAFRRLSIFLSVSLSLSLSLCHSVSLSCLCLSLSLSRSLRSVSYGIKHCVVYRAAFRRR